MLVATTEHHTDGCLLRLNTYDTEEVKGNKTLAKLFPELHSIVYPVRKDTYEGIRTRRREDAMSFTFFIHWYSILLGLRIQTRLIESYQAYQIVFYMNSEAIHSSKFFTDTEWKLVVDLQRFLEGLQIK